MNVTEFNNYLKENITDEMFESLVLFYLSRRYRICACHRNKQGNKEYTLQDVFVGDTYFLILNFSGSDISGNYPLDQYMIANKDEATLFFLANRIWEQMPKHLPANARCLLPFLHQIDDNPCCYFHRDCECFDDRIDGLVKDKFKKYRKYIEQLYKQCVDETGKLLVQEGYLLREKDWNGKKKFKLTGEKGENRVCEISIDAGIGCVCFQINKPFCLIHYYLIDEQDIPLLAEQILRVIKDPFDSDCMSIVQLN